MTGCGIRNVLCGIVVLTASVVGFVELSAPAGAIGRDDTTNISSNVVTGEPRTLSASISGSSGTPKDTVGESHGNAGGTRINDTKYGISFTLPNEWNQVSLDGNDVGALLGKASQLDPSLKSTIAAEATSSAEKGLKFFAVSPGAVANVNIGVFNGAAPLAQLDVQAKLAIASFGGKDLHAKEIRFPFGSAVAGTYIFQLTSGTSVYGTQVYASHGGRTYVTTFSSEERSLETAAASSMMSSWRFT
jgi:hypothetical protein